MSKQSDCGSPCSLKTQQITTPMIQAILTVLKTLNYVFKSTKVKSRKMQSLHQKKCKKQQEHAMKKQSNSIHLGIRKSHQRITI